MMKVFAVTFLKMASETTEVAAAPVLGRAELESLFQDDFAAHAMIIKSRKAARSMPHLMAA